VGDVKLSLCGGLKDPDTTIPEETFLQHEVTFDTFCEKPSLMTNQNLVVKLGGRFYNWQVAMPIILSVVAFQKPLPQVCSESLSVSVSLSACRSVYLSAFQPVSLSFCLFICLFGHLFICHSPFYLLSFLLLTPSLHLIAMT
jgi:hypothetical protein